jgi:prophage antirepressor-like protein
MAKQTDNTSSAVVPFLFEGDGLVRVVPGDGEPWFVAADVARVLGYRDAEKALRLVANDEKGTLEKGTFGLNQDLSLVSESGLYLLIFRSRKPNAIKFRKWVTADVLPSIRKTGSYRSPRQQGLSPEIEAARWEHKSALDTKRVRINAMHAATRALDAIRRASGTRAAALAAPSIYAALGINIDPNASDTLAQGELWPDERAEDTVH